MAAAGPWATLDQFETPVRLFAKSSGAQVYAVEHGLAPEYRWPTQIEQAGFVVRWLHALGAERGVDPQRIALGGDPAGGNMTCVLALKLCHENGLRLALQVPLTRKPRCRSRPGRGWRTAPGCICKPRACCCSPGT